MTLTQDTLKNIVLFMQQAPHGEGVQAVAWAETFMAVHAEIAAMEAKKPAVPGKKEEKKQ